MTMIYYRPFWEFCRDPQTALTCTLGLVCDEPDSRPWDNFGFEEGMAVWSLIAYVSNAGASQLLPQRHL